MIGVFITNMYRGSYYRSYQLCLSAGVDMCTPLFSLEMKIPYIETVQRKSYISEDDSDKDDHAREIDDENVVIVNENGEDEKDSDLIDEKENQHLGPSAEHDIAQ